LACLHSALLKLLFSGFYLSFLFCVDYRCPGGDQNSTGHTEAHRLGKVRKVPGVLLLCPVLGVPKASGTLPGGGRQKLCFRWCWGCPKGGFFGLLSRVGYQPSIGEAGLLLSQNFPLDALWALLIIPLRSLLAPTFPIPVLFRAVLMPGSARNWVCSGKP